jgi:putative tricarboxylic transport membrane protein
MKNCREIVPGIIWMGLGLFIAIYSYQLELGNFKNLGPGFMPFCVGVLLIICAIPILIGSYASPGLDLSQNGKRLLQDFHKPASVLATLLFYAMLLNTLGFILTAFIILLLLNKISGLGKWTTVLVFSVVTVLATYALFVVILNVQLPSGWWRIG